MLAAEPAILAHVNADHADALARIAGSPGWRLAAADVDGCDLVREDAILRVPWSAPVADAAGIRAELVRLARGGQNTIV